MNDDNRPIYCPYQGQQVQKRERTRAEEEEYLVYMKISLKLTDDIVYGTKQR